MEYHLKTDPTAPLRGWSVNELIERVLAFSDTLYKNMWHEDQNLLAQQNRKGLEASNTLDRRGTPCRKDVSL